jgi:hypothetical protein
MEPEGSLFRVYKRLTPDSFLRYKNPVYILISYFFKIRFNIILSSTEVSCLTDRAKMGKTHMKTSDKSWSALASVDCKKRCILRQIL